MNTQIKLRSVKIIKKRAQEMTPAQMDIMEFCVKPVILKTDIKKLILSTVVNVAIKSASGYIQYLQIYFLQV